MIEYLFFRKIPKKKDGREEYLTKLDQREWWKTARQTFLKIAHPPMKLKETDSSFWKSSQTFKTVLVPRELNQGMAYLL